jgi:hypothetical protein
MQNTSNHVQIRQIPSTSGGLIRSTLLSGAAALAVLVIVYLPAEYGRDPTGFGALLGLTEMGLIKQQLYAEDAADRAAPQGATDPAIIARLDAIEAQLAMMNAVIGAPPAAVQAELAVPAPPAVSAPENAAKEAPDAAAPAADAPAAAADPMPASTAPWRDEVSFTLAPGEGIEVKLAMDKGQTAQFEWTANGGVVNYDTHGDGGGQKISYEKGRAVAQQAGALTAAFTGNHGWFWRNRTDAPVTLTLRTKGEYTAPKQ